jgi:hypothetical protein
MRKIKLFIDKNPELTEILIGLLFVLIIGIAYSNLEIMFEVALGSIVFGTIIGFLFYFIKRK